MRQRAGKGEEVGRKVFGSKSQAGSQKSRQHWERSTRMVGMMGMVGMVRKDQLWE